MFRIVTLVFALAVGGGAHAAGAGDSTNIRLSPLGLLVGSVNVGVDFVVSSQWTLGPTLDYWNLRITSNDGNSYSPYALSVGARANWFSGSVFTDGLYVGPSLRAGRVSMKVRNDRGETSYERTSVLAGGLVGYAWYWTAFNIHLGGGVVVDVAGDKVEVKNSDGTYTNVRTSMTSFDAEFSVGYTF